MEMMAAIKGLSALAQQSRMEVFRLLVSCGNDGMAAGKIAQTLNVPHNTMSSHLSILANAKLVSSHRQGRSIIYKINFPNIQKLFSFLMEDCCQGRPEACGTLIGDVLQEFCNKEPQVVQIEHSPNIGSSHIHPGEVEAENVTSVHPSTKNVIGLFERGLTLWVGASIIAGIGLGILFPEIFTFLAGIEYAKVNLVVAVMIWVMIYPMMVNVDFASLSHIGDRPKGLVITLAVNWLVKPFTMAALGVLFFEVVFRDLIPPEDASQYIAGLILLGAAPCTAMVFVWSQLSRGDATYTLVQVSVNDVIMVFAFAPIVAFLLGVTDITVPWETLLISVFLYVVAPLTAGAITRKMLTARRTLAVSDHAGTENGHDAIDIFSQKLKPFSIIGLLATVVLLFGFQGGVIIDKPFIILLIAVPLIIQSYGIFIISYLWAWLWRVPFNVAAPCAFIGTSNFFELAVAVAISLFGLQSGAALATVVGVLVEVPVMLSLVAFANRTRSFFPTGEQS